MFRCLGAFGGYVANANALIAAQTPKENAGRSLGILVTGMTSGTLLGPLVGGTLATLFSYRFTFLITGALMLMVLLLTVFLVREVKQPKPTTATTTTPYVKKNLRTLIQNRLILILFLTTFFVQIVNMSISPILSLFVRQLNANPHTISFVAGLVAAMPGIATIIAAPRFGKLGDKIGSHRIAILGFCIAMVAFTATSLASNTPL